MMEFLYSFPFSGTSKAPYTSRITGRPGMSHPGIPSSTTRARVDSIKGKGKAREEYFLNSTLPREIPKHCPYDRPVKRRPRAADFFDELEVALSDTFRRRGEHVSSFLCPASPPLPATTFEDIPTQILIINMDEDNDDEEDNPETAQETEAGDEEVSKNEDETTEEAKAEWERISEDEALAALLQLHWSTRDLKEEAEDLLNDVAREVQVQGSVENTAKGKGKEKVDQSEDVNPNASQPPAGPSHSEPVASSLRISMAPVPMAEEKVHFTPEDNANSPALLRQPLMSSGSCALGVSMCSDVDVSAQNNAALGLPFDTSSDSASISYTPSCSVLLPLQAASSEYVDCYVPPPEPPFVPYPQLPCLSSNFPPATLSEFDYCSSQLGFSYQAMSGPNLNFPIPSRPQVYVPQNTLPSSIFTVNTLDQPTAQAEVPEPPSALPPLVLRVEDDVTSWWDSMDPRTWMKDASARSDALLEGGGSFSAKSGSVSSYHSPDDTSNVNSSSGTIHDLSSNCSVYEPQETSTSFTPQSFPPSVSTHVQSSVKDASAPSEILLEDGGSFSAEDAAVSDYYYSEHIASNVNASSGTIHLFSSCSLYEQQETLSHDAPLLFESLQSFPTSATTHTPSVGTSFTSVRPSSLLLQEKRKRVVSTIQDLKKGSIVHPYRGVSRTALRQIRADKGRAQGALKGKKLLAGIQNFVHACSSRIEPEHKGKALTTTTSPLSLRPVVLASSTALSVIPPTSYDEEETSCSSPCSSSSTLVGTPEPEALQRGEKRRRDDDNCEYREASHAKRSRKYIAGKESYDTSGIGEIKHPRAKISKPPTLRHSRRKARRLSEVQGQVDNSPPTPDQLLKRRTLCQTVKNLMLSFWDR